MTFIARAAAPTLPPGQKECLAGNAKIYAQMVSIIGKYSKFASAGEKAQVRQAPDLVPATKPNGKSPDES